MDTFEIFNEFRELLASNLSARTIQKCVALLYEHQDYAEELFDALLESLREALPSKRLSLFYLMDAIIKHSAKYHFFSYSTAITGKLREIIDLVVDAVNRKSDKNGGCGNIGSVRKILLIWRGKELLEEKIFVKLDKYLSHMAEQAPSSSTLQNKESIWRRMEDDRDRQKKAREESWVRHVDDENAVFPSPIRGGSAPQSGLADDGEFLSAWEKASIPSRTDYELFQKMKEKFKYRP